MNTIGVMVMLYSIIGKKSPRPGCRPEHPATDLRGRTRLKRSSLSLGRLDLCSRYFLKRSKIDISQNVRFCRHVEPSSENLDRRVRTKRFGSSKGHSYPAKKYIRPVFMFGRLSGNRIPDVLIAWNEPDRRRDGEIVENFHSHFVVN